MYLVGGIFSGDWAQNRARELVEFSSMVCVVLFILDDDVAMISWSNFHKSRKELCQ